MNNITAEWKNIEKKKTTHKRNVELVNNETTNSKN